MKITGSKLVIELLKKHGVELIFGYPGGQIMPIYDSLYQCGIRHILTKHEQGACHAADAYARVTGKPGVVFATSGPGATNLVTGLANALMDSIPLVAVTGQVPTRSIGTDAFQEADIYGITIPVTKYNYLIKNIAHMPETFAEAFYVATTGRPGPVLIDIPKDVQFASIEYDPDAEIPIPILKYKPETEHHYDKLIDKAAEWLRTAERPVLYVGGGSALSGAADEVRQLARQANLPTTTTLLGLGEFPGDGPLFLGMPGMHGTRYANEAIDKADLLISAGARFDDRVTGDVSKFATRAKVIHIDIDPAEHGKVIHPHLALAGNLKTVLRQLLERMNGVELAPRTAWMEQIAAWKQQYPLTYAKSETVIKPQYVLEQIADITQGEAIITTGVGQHQMWAAQYCCIKQPRSWVTSGGLGTMGYCTPSAIGAQLGQPQRTVICITGDGSFQMNIQELATASFYRIPIKIFLFDNGYLGMVRQWQEFFFDRRYSETHLEFGNPDFVAIAKGYGLHALKITTPDEVVPAIRRALETPGPVLVHCVIEKEENVYPMIPSGKSVHDTIG